VLLVHNAYCLLKNRDVVNEHLTDVYDIAFQLNSIGSLIQYQFIGTSSPFTVMKPVGSVREERSVNVLIGVGFRTDSLHLYYFMFDSGYTFSSNRHSFYIIILDPSMKSVSVHTSSAMLSTFLLYLSTM
jgi:hypothetical protein